MLIFLCEGQLLENNLIDHDPDRVDITLRRVQLLEKDLGGQESRRPYNRTIVVHPLIGAEAQIGDLNLSPLTGLEENIVRLDISMDNILSMETLDGVEHLQDVGEDESLVEVLG